MSGLLNNSLFLSTAAAAGGYQVERSLRFNSSDSAYLSRTPGSAGNRKTWTWAGWVKRSYVGATYKMLFSADNGAHSCGFRFTNSPSDTIEFFEYNGGFTWQLVTTQVFRDLSAWYHIVVVFDSTQGTSTNRLKLYVNGTQVTAFGTASYPSPNYDSLINAAVAHNIGAYAGIQNFDGYLADVHFIDGQALTPSSFTEVSATTGQLIPKAYTGSFGTNGFWLKFSDNSNNTAATLGKDYSGNSNNWTPNNLSVTAGAGNDSLVDTPTSYGTDTYVGGEVRGNYATWNPLNKGSNLTISNGNLDLTGSTGHATVLTTIPVVAGMKSYMEFTVTSTTGGGWGVTTNSAAENSYGELAGKWWGYDNGGSFNIINQTTVNGYSPRISNGNILQIAIDYATGKVHLGINNSWINSTNGTDGNPATGANPTFTLSTTSPIFPILESNGLFVACNFGQRPFAYTAPSGFKALVDTNLTAPVVAKPNTVMDVLLWSGNNASPRSLSGLNFSPDFAWLKVRSDAAGHSLFDTVRGVGKSLETNITGAEVTNSQFGYISAFDSSGFTVTAGTYPGFESGSVNMTGRTYVAWAWDAGSSTASNTQGSITSQVRANVSAGFSVVAFNSGSGAPTAYTVGHGLNVAPQFIIAKSRTSASYNWSVYHTSIATTTNKYLSINSANATADNGTSIWGAAQPTSTVFGITSGNAVVANTDCIAYCFAPVVGYSSMGSYVGNGSASDGPFVFCNFRPRWVLVKSTGSAENWFLLDSARNTYNAVNSYLMPNSQSAEDPNNSTVNTDFLSNGFKLRASTSALNSNGVTYIYCAFAENPFQYARAR